MDNLITTIGIAFVLIALAIAGLAIGWIITGKSKMRGSCGGKRPTDSKDCQESKSCGLCGKGEEDECDK